MASGIISDSQYKAALQDRSLLFKQTLKLMSTPAPFLNLLNLFWNY